VSELFFSYIIFMYVTSIYYLFHNMEPELREGRTAPSPSPAWAPSGLGDKDISHSIDKALIQV